MVRRRDDELLVQARRVLDPIWEECAVTGFVGRCWGRKRLSSIEGTTIVLCDGHDVVVVYQEQANGPIKMKFFSRKERSPLADRVEKTLISEGLIGSGSLS